MINARLKVTNFEKELESAIKKEMNGRLTSLSIDPTFISSIRDSIDSRMRGSRHYTSLLHGDLAVEFGLENPASDVEDIIAAIKQFVRIEYNASSLNFSVVIQFDYENINSGYYLSNGNPVPWLSWLLEAGSSIVVADFRFINGNFESSRTGGGLMVPGGEYSVSPEYAGTEGSNWITEALSGIEDDIFDEVGRRL